MPFASAAQATDSKGAVKKGYRKITDKNGRIKYLSDAPAVRKSQIVKDAPKEKVVKPKKSKTVKEEVKDDKPESFDREAFATN